MLAKKHPIVFPKWKYQILKEGDMVQSGDMFTKVIDSYTQCATEWRPHSFFGFNLTRAECLALINIRPTPKFPNFK